LQDATALLHFRPSFRSGVDEVLFHRYSRGSARLRAPHFPFEAAMMPLVYKICPEPLWREAERAGRFRGAPIDIQDGYIHFSTAAQVRKTAAKHFRGQGDLLLIAVQGERLGAALRYEPSRGGDLFPHLYAELDPRAALWVKPLPLGPEGAHVFPDLVA
jgi:uncharacterized protein (DUF952 family)